MMENKIKTEPKGEENSLAPFYGKLNQNIKVI